MKYQISHLTRYRYQQEVANCYNLSCLSPRKLAYQKTRRTRLEVNPSPSSLYDHLDFFGNRHTFFHVNTLHSELEVKISSLVEVLPRAAQIDIEASMPWEQVIQHLGESTDAQSLHARLLRTATKMTPIDPLFRAFAETVFEPDMPILEGAQRLSHLINSEFTYDPGFTTLATPVHTVLQQKRGVCQDFAQLAISALRSMGIPARYVSGYLETLPPPGQERLVGADASHAWFSVFDPQQGWVDFDPTNDLIPDERHITLAFGRDYADVVPLKGLMSGGGQHELTVEVDVMPLHDDAD
ncbi:transglutaminase family protein [Pokkaliibacter sp. CJK22405]|uniref:transglutaminase family protein n=1 Tax=Pokkaliibacter sp. CJK22405 TaxID=3384615 RepID=UPI0039854182